jgi:hypothetical protein
MRTISLTKGAVAIVDDDDYPALAKHRWCTLVAGKKRYAVRGGGRVLMHCEILGVDGVDHKSGGGLDNRRENLRPATARENNRNRVKKSGCSSRYIGVCWDKREGKWQAYARTGPLRPDGRMATRQIGLFDSEEEAAVARDDVVRHAYGEFARLNFPQVEAS